MTSVGIPHSVAAALPTLSVFDITNELSRDVANARPERGIAYVTAAVPSSLVRVSERESGFFCDVESLLERLFPSSAADRRRMLFALLGPARSRSRSIAPPVPRPVAARAALLLRRRRPRRLHADAAGVKPGQVAFVPR